MKKEQQPLLRCNKKMLSPSVVESLEQRRLFATLTAGVSVVTGVRGPGAQKNWSIDLTAGQAVLVAAGEASTNSSSTFATELILIAPNGRAIARSVASSAAGDAGGSFLGKVAPVSGTYRVRVRDVGRNDDASVRVTAVFAGQQPIVDGDDAFTVDSGRRFAATIEPGDLDVWKVPARSAAQLISAVATENTPGSPVDIGLFMIGAVGEGLAGKESATGATIDVPNALAGDYYAVVYEAGANATGRYGFSAAIAPGPQYTGDPDTATALSSGVTRTGDLPGGDIDLFNVPIGRGDTATVNISGTSGSLDPELLLVNDAGTIVARAASTTGARTASITYKSSESAFYSIIVRDKESDDGGMYNLVYTLT